MKARSIDKKYNAIEKCLQILSMYSLDKSSFSIKEICDQLNFNVSTTYRILSTLEDYGYVSRLKNKEYVIGTQALYLSAKDFAGNVSKGNVQTKADVEEKVSDSTPY